MTSLKEKWNYKIETTLGEMFNSPQEIPNKGVLLIAEELEKTMGTEKVLQLLETISEKGMINTAKGMTKDKPINSFQDFLKLFEKTREENLWDKINVDESIKITENSRKVNTVECVYADVWKEWGRPDLGYAYQCSGDFALAKTLHPNLRLIRTKTLMQGDDCCDFKFIWEEKD